MTELLRSTEALSREFLVSQLKHKLLGGGGQKCFESCSISGGMVSPLVGSRNVRDLNIPIIVYPRIMSAQNVVKGGGIFILGSKRQIVLVSLPVVVIDVTRNGKSVGLKGVALVFNWR